MVELEIYGKQRAALMPTQPREIEFRSLVDRHRLLLAAFWLLIDWPNRFAETCILAKVTPSFVLLGRRSEPYWFVIQVLTKLHRPIPPYKCKIM